MYTFYYSCDTCAPGFYGNAKLGTPVDCKRCACPLIEDENNFSSTCQLRDASFEHQNEVTSDYSLISYQNSDYVCTQCSDGHVGDHCERYVKRTICQSKSILIYVFQLCRRLLWCSNEILIEMFEMSMQRRSMRSSQWQMHNVPVSLTINEKTKILRIIRSFLIQSESFAEFTEEIRKVGDVDNAKQAISGIQPKVANCVDAKVPVPKM